MVIFPLPVRECMRPQAHKNVIMRVKSNACVLTRRARFNPGHGDATHLSGVAVCADDILPVWGVSSVLVRWDVPEVDQRELYSLRDGSHVVVVSVMGFSRRGRGNVRRPALYCSDARRLDEIDK